MANCKNCGTELLPRAYRDVNRINWSTPKSCCSIKCRNEYANKVRLQYGTRTGSTRKPTIIDVTPRRALVSGEEREPDDG